MKHKKIWIVDGETGEYETTVQWTIGAFYSEEVAGKITDYLNELAKLAFEKYPKPEGRRFTKKDFEDFEQSEEWKKLLESDPDARMDSRGTDYNCYSLDIKDSELY